MGVVARSIVVSTALAMAGACALPSVDEFASGSGAADDGGKLDAVALDGSTVAPIGDSATDGGPPRVNLLEGTPATFDDGTCGDVGAFRSVLKGDAVARTGAGSCRVCRVPPTGPFTIDTNFLAPVPAGTYHARAWVRRAPGLSQPFDVSITLRLMKEDFTQIEERTSAGLALTNEWQPVVVDFPVTARFPRMDTYVGGDPGVGPACFLVDDYEVWRD